MLSAFRALLGGAVVLLSVSAAPLAAQGNLSVLGLGYAPGQLSTPTRATGGATAEFDPVSPLNPAALASWGRPAIHVQSEPEYRRTVTPGLTDNTSTSRYSLIAAGMNIFTDFAIGLSFSTMLDRSWSLVRQGAEIVGPDSVTFTDRNSVRGAIADSRFGVAWSLPAGLKIGLAGHAITGTQLLRNERAYDTAFAYVSYNIGRTLHYVGRAYSVGATWEPVRWFGIAGSYRRGGKLDAEAGNDSVVGRATIPDRYGIGIRSEVARGLVLSARTEHIGWTSLAGLLSDSSTVHDANEYGVGLEYGAASIAGIPLALRAGTSHRVLPFGPGSTPVNEQSIAGGAGVLVGGGRAGIDLTVQRALRSAAGGLNERAWTVSLGLIVRP